MPHLPKAPDLTSNKAVYLKMLAAEHYALENKAVQSMLVIRERELVYMESRMEAIGWQAAIVAGFIIRNFVANFLGPESDLPVEPTTLTVFYYSTAFGMAFSFHVILSTTFLCIWGPGLALRGSAGSVSRAYNEMKAERWQIVCSFNLSILAFGAQCICVFEAYDGVRGFDFDSGGSCEPRRPSR